MLVCVFLCMLAHEIAGAARTRSSLRPLISKGEDFQKTSGASCHENAKSCLQLEYRHCEEHLRRSNPFFLYGVRWFAALHSQRRSTITFHSAAFAVLPNIRVGVAKPHDVPSV